MFTTLFVQPVFNLLVLIYALIPAHNLGLAIIIFTVLIRLLMWPLVKKQLNHTRALRELQPELRKIKQAAKGDRQKESMMVMELYKEREINMFAPFGILLVQIPIFLALYSGLKRLIDDPQALSSLTYGFVRDLPWIKEVAADMDKFDATLFGAVDLTRSALPDGGGIYWPAMLLVAASAAVQYFQSKQLMPSDDKARSLRQILKDAGDGKHAEREEMTAATNRMMRYFIPAAIFFFTVNIPSALSLYWVVGGLVAFAQQRYILRQDTEDLERAVDANAKLAASPADRRRPEPIEAEIIPKKATKEEVKIAKSGVKVTISRPSDDTADKPYPSTLAAKKKQKRKRRRP